MDGDCRACPVGQALFVGRKVQAILTQLEAVSPSNRILIGLAGAPLYRVVPQVPTPPPLMPVQDPQPGPAHVPQMPPSRQAMPGQASGCGPTVIEPNALREAHN